MISPVSRRHHPHQPHQQTPCEPSHHQPHQQTPSESPRELHHRGPPPYPQEEHPSTNPLPPLSNQNTPNPHKTSTSLPESKQGDTTSPKDKGFFSNAYSYLQTLLYGQDRWEDVDECNLYLVGYLKHANVSLLFID